MRKFIYNTEGTGISHEQIRRLETTQPGVGTYLGADMDGHPLGDEIMLLDGMDGLAENPLAGLGFVGSGNYESRAYDMNEFSLSATALPSSRRAGRDFQPYGLGEGGASHPRGRRAGRDFSPYGLGHVSGQSVSEYRSAKSKRPDRFISPSFYPLGQAPTWNPQAKPETFFQAAHEGNTESYERWSQTPKPGTWLDGLGSADGDRRAAMATAAVIKSGCLLGCAAADMPTADRTRCRSACDAVYAGAVGVINAALPPGMTGGITPAQQRVIDEQLRLLEQARFQSQSGQVPTTGMSTQTMVLIGGGVLLAVGLIAVVALRR